MSSYEEQQEATKSVLLPPVLASSPYEDTLQPQVKAPPTTRTERFMPLSPEVDASTGEPLPAPDVTATAQNRTRRPPPPPPPPHASPPFQSHQIAFNDAFGPSEAEGEGRWDSTYDWSGFSRNGSENAERPDIFPADVVVVHTAADLSLVRIQPEPINTTRIKHMGSMLYAHKFVPQSYVCTKPNKVLLLSWP